MQLLFSLHDWCRIVIEWVSKAHTYIFEYSVTLACLCPPQLYYKAFFREDGSTSKEAPGQS